MGLFSKKKKKQQSTVKNEVEGISTQDVRIKIFRDLGSNTMHEVADFEATETRDSFGGLVIKNDKHNFMEDVDFEREEIFNELRVLLKIRNKSKEESLKILRDKITFQKKKLNYLDKFVELNAIYNYRDEQGILRNLIVLYNNIENITDGKGCFFTVEKNKRVYSFIKKDGQYHPIWHGIDDTTTYPDFTRKHKILAKEEEIFKSEWGEWMRKYSPHASLIMIAVILGILVCGNLFLGYKLLQKNEQADIRAQAGSLACSDQYNKITKQMGELLEIEVLNKALNRTIEKTESQGKNVSNEIKALDVIRNLGK